MPEAMEDMTNLYDSEQLQIRQICARVMEGKSASPQNARKVAEELAERLYDAGFKANVQMLVARHRATGEMYFVPEVEIMDRVEHEGEHDYDRHRHEVQTNILGATQPDTGYSAPVAMPGNGALWTPKGSR